MSLLLVSEHADVLYKTMTMKTSRLRIVVYFINWNDSYYFSFIREHYGKFCEKIIMYDNHSNDDSRSIAKNMGFEVRPFGYKDLNDQAYLDVKNHCWKEQRGKGIDLVIVVDADEFVCLPQQFAEGNLLFSEHWPTAPVVRGYNMIDDGLLPGTYASPYKSIFEIRTGAPSENYSKQAIFDPDAIEEISYIHGCHKNKMTGRIDRGNDFTACRLLHYRQIGGVDRMIERHRIYRNRMSRFNLKYNMGHHYLQEADQKRDEWAKLKSEAIVLW